MLGVVLIVEKGRQESKRQEPHRARIVQLLMEAIIMKIKEVMQEQAPTLEYLRISVSIRQS